MTRVVRGRLLPPTDAPPFGECTEEIVRLGDVVVEHILSGALPAPLRYDQDPDEWVVVLHGAAVLEVQGSGWTSRSGIGSCSGPMRRTG